MIHNLKINALGFYNFLYDIFKSKRLIWDLTGKDLKVRYLGSYLGILWAFIQPAFTIFIMWFVFQVGFKSSNISNVPFILWLSSGMIPWFFLSDGISSGTNSIIENSFLVKKIVFRVSVLPVVKIFAALLIHPFFIVVLALMFMSYGFFPNYYWLQIIYYLFCSFALMLGINFLTSSVVVFFRDFNQFVAIALQFLFWLTPIFWSMTMVPAKYKIFFEINPLYYIISGYRDSFIYNTGFLTNPLIGMVFWSETIIIFIIGAMVFKRLRSHFADVI